MNEVLHEVRDAQTKQVTKFVISTDANGMTVELANGDVVTLDLSGGVVTVYHHDADGAECEAVLRVTI